MAEDSDVQLEAAVLQGLGLTMSVAVEADAFLQPQGSGSSAWVVSLQFPFQWGKKDDRPQWQDLRDAIIAGAMRPGEWLTISGPLPDTTYHAAHYRWRQRRRDESRHDDGMTAWLPNVRAPPPARETRAERKRAKEARRAERKAEREARRNAAGADDGYLEVQGVEAGTGGTTDTPAAAATTVTRPVTSTEVNDNFDEGGDLVHYRNDASPPVEEHPEGPDNSEDQNAPSPVDSSPNDAYPSENDRASASEDENDEQPADHTTEEATVASDGGDAPALSAAEHPSDDNDSDTAQETKEESGIAPREDDSDSNSGSVPDNSATTAVEVAPGSVEENVGSDSEEGEYL
eukprot:m.1588896 g.1588896  ORF g.1588896 m.1588896 type:complete len:346 (+) comp25333_c0_seq2:6621-7658(+)